MKHRAVQHLFLVIAVLVGIGTSGFTRTFTLQQPTISLDQVAGLLAVAMMSFLELQLPGAQPQFVNVFIPKVQEEREPTSQPGIVVIEPQVFIYHSHNRESWLPELKKPKTDKPSEAFHAEQNVTLLGARLQRQLESKGVGALHSIRDYAEAVPSFNYNYSYKYSSTTVREVLAIHPKMTYLIDIHRDSQRRDKTTITIDGQNVARIFFIIGEGNPHWRENHAFAKSIHEEFNARWPGLSKGIINKGKSQGHGEYNQSLSPMSMLLEIGGVDNTLEESYRTIDMMAEVINDVLIKQRAE
jgi:stage II sporulation protein P